MNKQIKEICKEQEQHLISSVECNYKRATTSAQIQQIVYVYEKIYKRKWTDNISCSKCVLRLYKIIGEWWKNELNKISVQSEPKTQVVKKQGVKNKDKKTVTNK